MPQIKLEKMLNTSVGNFYSLCLKKIKLSDQSETLAASVDIYLFIDHLLEFINNSLDIDNRFLFSNQYNKLVAVENATVNSNENDYPIDFDAFYDVYTFITQELKSENFIVENKIEVLKNIIAYLAYVINKLFNIETEGISPLSKPEIPNFFPEFIVGNIVSNLKLIILEVLGTDSDNEIIDNNSEKINHQNFTVIGKSEAFKSKVILKIISKNNQFTNENYESFEYIRAYLFKYCEILVTKAKVVEIGGNIILEILEDTQLVLMPEILIQSSDISISLGNDKLLGTGIDLLKKFTDDALIMPMITGQIIVDLFNKFLTRDNIENFHMNDYFNERILGSLPEIIRCVPPNTDSFDRDLVMHDLLDDSEEKVQKCIDNIIDFSDYINEDKEQVHLVEPNFINNKYGFLGRCNLMSFNPKDYSMRIYFLKGGKPPYRPSFSSLEHIAQARIGAISGQRNNYYENFIDLNIFYPADSKDYSLRKINYDWIELKKLFFARNYFVGQLILLSKYDFSPLNNLCTRNYNDLQGSIYEKNLFEFHTVVRSMNQNSIDYFKNSVSLICRNYFKSKLGNFDCISKISIPDLRNYPMHLIKLNSLIKVSINLKEKELSLKNDSIEFTYVNSKNKGFFRVNQQIILYPKSNFELNPAFDGIYLIKGIIKSINESNIIIELKNKQVNNKIFLNSDEWFIENDCLENTLTFDLKVLFSQIKKLGEGNRELFHGKKAPSQPKKIEISMDFFSSQKKILESKQINIGEDFIELLKKAIHADNYFIFSEKIKSDYSEAFYISYIMYTLANQKDRILIITPSNDSFIEYSAILNRYNLPYLSFNNSIPQTENSFSTITRLNDASIGLVMRTLDEERIIITTAHQYILMRGGIDSDNFEQIIFPNADQMPDIQNLFLLRKSKKAIFIGSESSFNSQNKTQESDNLGVNSINISTFEKLLSSCIEKKWTDNYEVLDSKIFKEINPNIRNYIDEIKSIGQDHSYVNRVHAKNDKNSKFYLFQPYKANKNSSKTKLTLVEFENTLFDHGVVFLDEKKLTEKGKKERNSSLIKVIKHLSLKAIKNLDLRICIIPNSSFNSDVTALEINSYSNLSISIQYLETTPTTHMSNPDISIVYLEENTLNRFPLFIQSLQNTKGYIIWIFDSSKLGIKDYLKVFDLQGDIGKIFNSEEIGF